LLGNDRFLQITARRVIRVPRGAFL